MKENKNKYPSLPISLNLTAEMGEFLKGLLDLLSFVFLYAMRYLFFKKSREDVHSFFYLFGEDLSFSFGKFLLIFLLVLSTVMSGMSIHNFLPLLFGSFVLINFYLIFYRFNFYLRWLAFIVFFTFFLLEAFNLKFKKGREANFESEY